LERPGKDDRHKARRRGAPRPRRLRPLTDKEEVALALLLWKFYRSEYQARGGAAAGMGGNLITDRHVDNCLTALRLAKLVGVRDEFLRLMTEIPVMQIRVAELEKWEAV
jgi:hypothetical protein